MQRRSVYEKDIGTIRNYNKLIQYIARTSTTLREYNYESFKNKSSEQLGYYQSQLKKYQGEISFLLRELSEMLTGMWVAFDFRENG